MCWGLDTYGRFTASVSTTNVPRRIGGLRNAIQVATGGATTNSLACALLENQTVRCWGHGSLGGMGRGHTNRSNYAARPVFGPGGEGTLLRNIVQIEAAHGSACGLNTSGNVYCWGSGGHTGTYPDGTLYASRPHRTLPFLVPAIGGAVGSSLSNVVSLVSDNVARFCALIDDGDDTNGNTDGTVVCWGRYIQQNAGAGLLWLSPRQIPISTMSFG